MGVKSGEMPLKRRTGARRGLRWSIDKIPPPKEGKFCTSAHISQVWGQSGSSRHQLYVRERAWSWERPETSGKCCFWERRIRITFSLRGSSLVKWYFHATECSFQLYPTNSVFQKGSWGKQIYIFLYVCVFSRMNNNSKFLYFKVNIYFNKM